jgi:hypothetical protein
MKEDEVYFRIFLRGPQYPVIVISGNDIYPAFNIKDLGNACYSLSPPGSSINISVVDSTGEEFLYMTDQIMKQRGQVWTIDRLAGLYL